MNNIEDHALSIKREYMRNWRAANKDKVRDSNRRYWERRANKLKVCDGKAEGTNCGE